MEVNLCDRSITNLSVALQILQTLLSQQEKVLSLVLVYILSQTQQILGQSGSSRCSSHTKSPAVPKGLCALLAADLVSLILKL